MKSDSDPASILLISSNLHQLFLKFCSTGKYIIVTNMDADGFLSSTDGVDNRYDTTTSVPPSKVYSTNKSDNITVEPDTSNTKDIVDHEDDASCVGMSPIHVSRRSIRILTNYLMVLIPRLSSLLPKFRFQDLSKPRLSTVPSSLIHAS